MRCVPTPRSITRPARRALLPLAASIAATLVAASGAHGQDVRVGGSADAANVFPFVDYGFGLLFPVRYQQLYTASSFSEAVFIDAIRFHDGISAAAGLDAGISDGTYLVRFAVTDRAENGLGTDFDGNVAGFAETFFEGVLTSAGLRLEGTPYLYDPARGNLLLDVTVFAQARDLFGLDSSADAADGTSRVFHSFPPPFTGPFPVVADARGLVTTFETRLAVVPEPATVLLVGAGLAAIGLVGLRRRRGGGGSAAMGPREV